MKTKSITLSLFALTAAALLTGCELTEAELATANANLEGWLTTSLYTSGSCTNTDQDGNGYASCSASNQTTGREAAVECAYRGTAGSNCRYPKEQDDD